MSDDKEEKQNPNPNSAVRQQLASVLPKTYKDQAVKIHDYLSVSGSPITWDANGVVSLKGTAIPRSNIIDLISDLTRYRKNFEPHGVTQFIQTLAQLNLPLDLIGNEKRRTAILQAKQSGGSLAIPEPPIKKVKKEIKNKKVVQKRKVPPKKHVWKTW